MKKLVLLSLVFCAVFSTASAQSQGGGDQMAVLQQMKSSISPKMVEKTGLTPAQADKVIEINFEMRQAAAGLRDLSEADRSKKIAELKAAKEKKLSELLTADQIKAVNAFYEGMGRNMPQKPAN